MNVQVVEKPIGQIFGLAGMPDEVTTPVNQWASTPESAAAVAHIPQEDPDYVFRREILRDVMAWRTATSEPILLHGPTGCGKSSFVKQFAARIGIPLWQVTASEEMELSELFGHYTLGKGGETVWMDGPLTQAARHGGWLLIDEIDRLRPTVAVGLNGVLEGSRFTLSSKGGEVVDPAEGFRIICTANSNMAGDDTMMYNTAQIHDKSVLERFSMILHVPYAGENEERELLEKVFAVADDEELKYWFSEEGISVNDEDKVLDGEFVTRGAFINSMLKVAGMVRSQSVDGGNNAGAALERTMSTRTLLRWAKLSITFRQSTAQGLSAIHYALERSLTNGCTPTTKAAIHEMVVSVFNVQPQLG